MERIINGRVTIVSKENCQSSSKILSKKVRAGALTPTLSHGERRVT
jgi:hypothetical protein